MTRPARAAATRRRLAPALVLAVALALLVARTTGDFRLYTEDDVERLRTIRRMKPLRSTLEEMKQLLTSLEILSDPTAEAHARAAASASSLAAGHAEDNCRTLVSQLANAEEFGDLLADVHVDRS